MTIRSAFFFPSALTRTVDEEHVGRVDVGRFGTGLETFEILQEARAVTGELEVGSEEGEHGTHAFRVGGVVAFLPVAVVARRIGEEHQTDQELETGEVQIGTRPVRPGDSRVHNLIGTNRDEPIVPDCGNPWIRDEVEGHRVLSLLRRSRLFGEDANGSDIPRRRSRPGARNTRGRYLSQRYAGQMDTRNVSAVRVHRYENIRPHWGS